jgi:N-acetylglutamate synthase/N-acetylornithine aminotransferase
MICIAVTRIKNEADIIEAFVRHHAHYFDAILVSDDASTDDSLPILEPQGGRRAADAH